MEMEKFQIELLPEDSEAERIEAHQRVCCYLLQRYYEGCEEFECFGIFESINRRAGRERLFNASTEDGRDK